MRDAVYKIVELTGSSKTGIEGAIQNAIDRAGESLRNLSWFKVVESRGYIENKRVAYWQVTIKIGFNVDEAAPSKDESKKEEPKEKGPGKYRCVVCGYVYDPGKGDPAQDIKPGTSFEDLPDSWKCPECGVGKDKFEKI